jgi:hypothetical protein
VLERHEIALRQQIEADLKASEAYGNRARDVRATCLNMALGLHSDSRGKRPSAADVLATAKEFEHYVEGLSTGPAVNLGLPEAYRTTLAALAKNHD